MNWLKSEQSLGKEGTTVRQSSSVPQPGKPQSKALLHCTSGLLCVFDSSTSEAVPYFVVLTSFFPTSYVLVKLLKGGGLLTRGTTQKWDSAPPSTFLLYI